MTFLTPLHKNGISQLDNYFLHLELVQYFLLLTSLKKVKPYHDIKLKITMTLSHI